MMDVEEITCYIYLGVRGMERAGVHTKRNRIWCVVSHKKKKKYQQHTTFWIQNLATAPRRTAFGV